MRIDLLSRNPQVTPEQMLEGFQPTARFGAVNFDNYYPNPEYPSQAQTRDTLREFTANPPQPVKRLFRRPKPVEGVGFYLDGGFGVGKTHLLAAAWHAFEGRKVFLSYQELLYTIGMLGMHKAIEAFHGYELLCIDEFELDDPGNTHMTSTFLGQLMPMGTHVITTSNTQPEHLGQGRFNAEDFKRQIQAIAERFTVLSIDGPDYRQRGAGVGKPLKKADLTALEQSAGNFVRLTASELNLHLTRVHPARFSRMLEGIDTVLLDDLVCMTDQNIALRFVHFVDKVYDLNLRFAASGEALDHLFPATYRYGAYAKKYSRCLSRLTEMLSISGKKLEQLESVG
ncbi:cell division protein ZapE [Deinococcus cellulosilyticus]|uniref:Cell division protein ZapE n=1 Tax=Deinococcus cellulosilyticus (strain DSM 18568 / NBRC 106333 / KACC 11606 / 5516J-15) TaxID=1223518 RepID=A0A511MXD9_DEIC1|nr:cell division protein ZapE [Deinococcus cellulosilyticus]GEM45252.1 cell division protein ZapE [Deinococcus cellulosilyticus NBRC 106333 = KACC 11606]